MGSRKRELKARKKEKPVRPDIPKYSQGEFVTYETHPAVIARVDRRPDRSVNNYDLLTMGGVKHFIREDQIT